MEPEPEETREERIRRMLIENASGRTFSDALVIAAIVLGIIGVIAISFYIALSER
jgi:hypothetical protein